VGGVLQALESKIRRDAASRKAAGAPRRNKTEHCMGGFYQEFPEDST
jgi:hypothetical protein